MKKISGIILVVMVSSCSDDLAKRSRFMNPVTKDKQDIIEQKVPELALETKLLSEAKHSGLESKWSSPTIFPLLFNMNLVTHSDPKDLTYVASIYDESSELVYSTTNKLNFFKIDDAVLIHESKNELNEFYFLNSNSLNPYEKASLTSVPCAMPLSFKQSSKKSLMEVSCEKDGTKFIADFSSGRFATIEKQAELLGKNVLIGDWYKVSYSNTSTRSLFERDLDFKSPFTEISDPVVVPIKKNNFSAEKFLVASLSSEIKAEEIRHVLKVSNVIENETLDIPLESIKKGSFYNHSLSYAILSNKEKIIFKEYTSEGMNIKLNLFSLSAPFEKAVKLSNDQIISTFCKKAIHEGRAKKDPEGYQHCLNYDLDKLSVKRNVTLYDEDSFLVEIETASPIKTPAGSERYFTGAIVFDSDLKVVKTISMHDSKGSSFKFIKNGDSVYGASATHLYKFNEQGELDASVDFCSIIPECRKDQFKTIVSSNVEGRFFFVQNLVHAESVNARELIYEMKVK